jgi:hypothetical protein
LATLGRSAVIDAVRSGMPDASMVRNSNNASRNTRLDASPAMLPSKSESTPPTLLRSSEPAACLSSSVLTPNWASQFVADEARSSAFPAYFGSWDANAATDAVMPSASTSRTPNTPTTSTQRGEPPRPLPPAQPRRHRRHRDHDHERLERRRDQPRGQLHPRQHHHR